MLVLQVSKLEGIKHSLHLLVKPVLGTLSKAKRATAGRFSATAGRFSTTAVLSAKVDGEGVPEMKAPTSSEMTDSHVHLPIIPSLYEV